MKFSIFATENAIQFNLTPENEHEKEFVKILEKYKGEVYTKMGVDISMTQGNYLRVFGEREDTLAVTVNKEIKEIEPK